MVLPDKIEATCIWPWSVFHGGNGLTKAVSGGRPWPEWRKPHLGSTWRGDEWKKKSVVLSHQGTKSNFCVLCVLAWECRGESRKDYTNQHLHGLLQLLSQRWRINTSNQRNAKAPTHRDSVHNKAALQTNMYTGTNKPFTYKHISMSNHTDMNRQELRFTETYGNRRV